MPRLHVRVLERRGVIGGAWVTEQFHPGFRPSTAAWLECIQRTSRPQPGIIAVHFASAREKPLIPMRSHIAQV
jgi:hypothetical protein